MSWKKKSREGRLTLAMMPTIARRAHASLILRGSAGQISCPRYVKTIGLLMKIGSVVKIGSGLLNYEVSERGSVALCIRKMKRVRMDQDNRLFKRFYLNAFSNAFLHPTS